jgi:hypothetical protein
MAATAGGSWLPAGAMLVLLLGALVMLLALLLVLM